MPLSTLAEDLVRGALGKVGSSVRRAPTSVGDIGVISQKLFGVRRAIEQRSPEIMQKLDTGWNNYRQAVEGLDRELDSLARGSGIGPKDPRLTTVIQAAENRVPTSTLDPASQKLYAWWDAFRGEAATMMGFPIGDKTGKYFTHLVEPMNFPQMEAVLAGKAERTTLSEADQFRIRAIHAISARDGIPLGDAMKIMGGTPQYMRDLHASGTIPRTVFNAFEQARRGFPVWSQDFYDVARTYGRAVYRQHHLEPVLADVSRMAERDLPPNLRRELKDRIEHGLLRRPTAFDTLLQASAAPFETFIRTITGGRLGNTPGSVERAFRSIYSTTAFWDIGFNPSPIKKHYVADMMSMWAELGTARTAQAHYHALATDPTSKSLRAMARDVGVVRERIPDIELFESFLPPAQRGVKGALRKANEYAFLAYQKIDLLNQYTAWIGGYQKATAKGLSQPAAVEYANRILRYTVPRQTPFDIPGLLRSTPAKLAFQFSSKKMQRTELVWDQLKRATHGDWGPFARTVIGTAILTGLPLDELFAKKTGIDPERIPIYDVLGKMGFGMRKVLHSFFPNLGPAFQVAADVVRFPHDPTRALENLWPGASGRDIYQSGPVPLPLGVRRATTFAQELTTGQRRTRFGELVTPSTGKEALARYAGFDDPATLKSTQHFADALHEYHVQLGNASRDVSVLYYNTAKAKNDWSGFYDGLAAIQRKYPDIDVNESLINRAITRVEQERRERLTQRAPRGFLSRQPQTP